MNDDNYNSTDDSLEYLQNIAIGNIDIDISDIRRNSSIRSSYNSNIDAKKNIVVLPQEASDDECKNSIENVEDTKIDETHIENQLKGSKKEDIEVETKEVDETEIKKPRKRGQPLIKSMFLLLLGYL